MGIDLLNLQLVMNARKCGREVVVKLVEDILSPVFSDRSQIIEGFGRHSYRVRESCNRGILKSVGEEILVCVLDSAILVGWD